MDGQLCQVEHQLRSIVNSIRILHTIIDANDMLLSLYNYRTNFCCCLYSDDHDDDGGRRCANKHFLTLIEGQY